MVVPQFDPVATYAAALSTIIAAWNFYQWWTSGPKLVGFVSANMKTFGAVPHDNNIYVSISVSNRGDAPTTITNVGTLGFRNWLEYWRGEVAHATVINANAGEFGSQIPSELYPGAEFRSYVLQNENLERWSCEYLLFVCVYHTMSDKPYRIRLKPIINRKHSGG